MKIAKAGQATIRPAAPTNAAILPAVPDRPHTEFRSPVPSVSAHVLGAVLRGVRPATGVAVWLPLVACAAAMGVPLAAPMAL